MLNRGQFTFYRSFWEAIKVLPKKDRLPILESIISYALDGAEPATLTQSQLAFFSLVRPNLDASRKKAESGKQGGKVNKANGKQTESKPKQTESEKERENEKEKEVEIEGEKDKEQAESTAPHSGKPFTSFWDTYPSKIGREDAWEAWKALNPSPDTVCQIMTALDAWKKSGQWTEDGGRFIPGAAKFLSKGYWRSPPPPASASKKDIPKGASGELGEAELAALRRVMAQDIPNDEEVPL